MPTVKTAASCFAAATVIILIMTCIIAIIAIVLSIALIQKFRKDISKSYKMTIAQYCKALPSIAYTAAVTKPKVPGVYEYNLGKALLETSLFVTQSNCLNLVPIPNPPGFTDQYRMHANDPADGKRRMFVTVFTNIGANSTPETNKPGRFLIAFTGTFTLNEWRNDFTYPLVEASGLNNYEPGIQAHKGFYSVYMTVRDQIWKLYKENQNKIDELYITGHSLGGALSTLCAFDFALHVPIHYSFAAPRSGNVAYSNKFNQMLPTSLRIYNNEDIVHSVPPAEFLGGFVYQHTNHGIPFDINLGSIGANHVTAYADYLPRCIDNKAPCSSLDLSKETTEETN
jgi:hypothetical protein